MTSIEGELADAHECLARLAEFAGGDDYLSAGSVRQNVEAVQAALARLGAVSPSDAKSTTRRPHEAPTDTTEPRTVQLTRWALAEGGTVGRLAVLELLAEYDALRSALARPAATGGRDLTADDVRGAWHDVPSYGEHGAVFQHIADRLNRIAR